MVQLLLNKTTPHFQLLPMSKVDQSLLHIHEVPPLQKPKSQIILPYILQKMVTPAITAAASCIIAGSSVAGTTINGVVGGTDYNVVCGIQIENWTNLLLEKPCAVKNDGHIKIPPRQVLPGQKEIMVILAHKIAIFVVFYPFYLTNP